MNDRRVLRMNRSLISLKFRTIMNTSVNQSPHILVRCVSEQKDWLPIHLYIAQTVETTCIINYDSGQPESSIRRGLRDKY